MKYSNLSHPPVRSPLKIVANDKSSDDLTNGGIVAPLFKCVSAAVFGLEPKILRSVQA